MLRIEGRNILDRGFSGANVRDMETGRLTKEGAANMISGIRRGMGEGISKSSPSLIGKTSATIAESIGKNTEDLQRILNETSDENKQNIEKIIKSLSDSQDKQGAELIRAVDAITEQIEKLRIEAGDQGDELIEKLGLDKAKQQLGGGSLSTHPLADKFNKYIGADVGQSALSGLAQVARQPSLLLGFKPKRGEEAMRRGRASAIRSEQNKSIGNVMSMLSGEGDTGPGNTPGGQTQTKVMPKFSSGLDVESNIEETLLDMKKLLEQIAECSCDSQTNSLLSQLVAGVTIAAVTVAAAGTLADWLASTLALQLKPMFDSVTSSITKLFPNQTPVPDEASEIPDLSGLDVSALDVSIGAYNPYGVTVNEDGTVNVPDSPLEVAYNKVADFFGEMGAANQAARRSGGPLANTNTGPMLTGEEFDPVTPDMLPLPVLAAGLMAKNQFDTQMEVLKSPEFQLGAAIVAGGAVIYLSGGTLIPVLTALGLTSLTATAAEPSVVETGNAIENTIDLFTPQTNAPPVIQNITNNYDNSTNSNSSNVFSSQVRDDSNSVQRAQDRTRSGGP